MDVTGHPPHIAEFKEIWRGTDKVVFSRTLTSVSTSRPRLEREFDPDAIRQLKATAEGDVLVGGPVLASEAIDAGLVDEPRQVEPCSGYVRGAKEVRDGPS
jgi:dihydrofolate reductase